MLSAMGGSATTGFKITGWGTCVPDKVVTNEDLALTLDTSDEWVRERTGIRERRIGGSTASLAVGAGKVALEQAGLTGADIDILILATTTPDKAVPGTSSTVQAELGVVGGAFDLNAACSGFVYGLVVAQGMLRSGAKRVLLIGAETLSRITDWDDRKTAVLFGDGAGALVLEATDGQGSMLSWDLGSDGSLNHLLYADLGGYLWMDGKEVFRRAVRIVVDSAKKVIDEAGITTDDLALIVPHQANLRIIQAVCQRLGLPEERAAMVIERYGNTSSASIPLALVDALEHDRVKDGDLLLLTGFGAGMTWASAVLRWPG
jgi:3-oxoacyl-[acyl-carrier-protein] synthase-3